MPRLPKDWTPLNIKLNSELAQWIEENRGQISKTDLTELAIELLRLEINDARSGKPSAIKRLNTVNLVATQDGLQRTK